MKLFNATASLSSCQSEQVLQVTRTTECQNIHGSIVKILEIQKQFDAAFSTTQLDYKTKANKEIKILPWMCSSTERPIKSRIRNIAGHEMDRLTGPPRVVHCGKIQTTLTHCRQIRASLTIQDYLFSK